ncbi:MAG: non-canonical purine NTP pyrophosphatase [Thermoplasmata archaeon]
MVGRAAGPSRVTFVTSNSAKLAEVTAYFETQGISVGAELRRLPEVQADDLDRVVAGKLGATGDLQGSVLVEDSGLFVDALKGFPGPYSAYVYRTLGLEGLLRLLEGHPRGAVFRTVAGLRLSGRTLLLPGEVRGEIIDRPRGDHGFAYDPVFRPEGVSRSFGEMSLSEKNAHSHRARALARVVVALREAPRTSAP